MSKILIPPKLSSSPAIVLAHHSVGDWDKLVVNWRLDTGLYISPPSSLHFFTAGNACFLCRLADALNLPAGRIITYLYLEWIDNYMLTFRNQAPLDSANLSNTYLIVDINWNHIGLAKRVNDVYTLIGQLAWVKSYATWYRIRITWWTTYDDQNNASLAVHFEREVAGEWVSLGVLYDGDNLWHDSDTNRCGPAVSTSYVHFDDTEIWKPEE